LSFCAAPDLTGLLKLFNPKPLEQVLESVRPHGTGGRPRRKINDWD
jgi:hypothetical protein